MSLVGENVGVEADNLSLYAYESRVADVLLSVSVSEFISEKKVSVSPLDVDLLLLCPDGGIWGGCSYTHLRKLIFSVGATRESLLGDSLIGSGWWGVEAAAFAAAKLGKS